MTQTQLQSLTTALADRYRVVREIGRGGMATVYLADDPKHHRQVAIKVFNADVFRVLRDAFRGGPDASRLPIGEGAASARRGAAHREGCGRTFTSSLYFPLAPNPLTSPLPFDLMPLDISAHFAGTRRFNSSNQFCSTTRLAGASVSVIESRVGLTIRKRPSFATS